MLSKSKELLHMKIISDCQEIDKENPFKDDILGNRKQFGKSLEKLITNCGNDRPLVIGIDGQWGEGKTYFLKRWCQTLENSDKKIIYLDAFQSDYTEEPFFAIISEIYGFLQNIKGDDNDEFNDKLEELAKKTTAVGSYVCKRSADILFQKMAGVESVGEEVEKIIDISSTPHLYQMVSEDFMTKYHNYVHFKEDFESFKICLKDCADLNLSKNGFPIVFIIDELDRCSPTYALELLEKIKHFFSVDGIVFILSMNKNQLVNSIRNIYGIESDADLYLQKFITIEASMPKSLNHHRYSDTHYADMCSHYAQITGISYNFCSQSVLAILRKFNFNFRDCQKAFTYFSIIERIDDGDLFSFLLSALKVKKPDKFAEFKANSLGYKSLIEEVLDYNREIDEDNLDSLIEDILFIYEISYEEQNYIENYTKTNFPGRRRKNNYFRTCEILDLFRV